MSASGQPLAISLGDPAGIGPELIAEVWTQRGSLDMPPFAVFGGAEVLRAAARTRGMELPVAIIDHPRDAGQVFGDALPVVGTGDAAVTPGRPDREGAVLALHSLVAATRAALTGDCGGLVTLPVAKAQLAAAGFEHPGQTEYLAAACGRDPRETVMMLAGPSLRTVPITVHVPLAAVPQLLTGELICRKARVVHGALIRDFGIERPRLAFTGLNPHAGEQGQMGDEEAEIIAPAIEVLRGEGIEASGPHPADALFTHRARETYDAAMAMYHDQALIPLKALDFDEGVNVTLGLPIVRTSPDHGTAFDIAGEGMADAGATIAAIRLAGAIAARRARA